MNAPFIQHLLALRAFIGRRLIALTEREPHLHTQRIFSAGIYAWLALGTLLLLPYYGALWGPASLANRPTFDPSRWDHWFAHLSLHPMLEEHAYVFIVGQLACLGLVLARRWPRLAAVGVYFFTFNIYQRTGQILDGGNNLAQLLMFYFVLMNVSGRPVQWQWRAGRKALTALSNVAFWMCRIQIVVVYLSAGVLKLNGALWQKGMALYYILQGESYTHPLARELVVALPEVAMMATYATMLFQILFVVLIWHRPARPYLIAAGVGLHLCGIALGMGLLLFGLVMCLGYLAFLPPEMSRRFREPLTSSDKLLVVWPVGAKRLGVVLRVIEWLDLRRRLEFLPLETATGLSTVGNGGTPTHGLAALARIAARVPAVMPLLPLGWAAWYLGLAQPIYGRYLVPPSVTSPDGQPSQATAAETPAGTARGTERTRG